MNNVRFSGAPQGSRASVTSPCTGVCKLDAATGWCLGCGRTGAEMDGWGIRTEASRQAVWDLIPGRLSQLGVTCRRLPWTTDEVRAFVATSLEDGQGTWAMGVEGAVVEFKSAPGQCTRVTHHGDALVAQTRNCAIGMLINDDVRALSFDPPGLGSPPRIVLAVKRERGRLPVTYGVTDLGPDENALIQDTHTRLFDLALGRKEARFCIRVAPGTACSDMERVLGLPLSQPLPKISGAFVQESPTRVIETALGRIEVQGAIPWPDALSLEGPHTHLLPEHLATGRALPVRTDLPRAYWPGAIFYPST